MWLVPIMPLNEHGASAPSLGSIPEPFKTPGCSRSCKIGSADWGLPAVAVHGALPHVGAPVSWCAPPPRSAYPSQRLPCVPQLGALIRTPSWSKGQNQAWWCRESLGSWPWAASAQATWHNGIYCLILQWHFLPWMCAMAKTWLLGLGTVRSDVFNLISVSDCRAWSYIQVSQVFGWSSNHWTILLPQRETKLADLIFAFTQQGAIIPYLT